MKHEDNCQAGVGTDNGRRGAGTDQCNSHNNQKATPGIEHSISPGVPCPETVLAAAMTDGSYLLMAYPQREPAAFVAPLLNHMVFENLAHAALVTGGPMPESDAGTDYLGDDHVAAFQASAERAHAALTDPALLHRTFGPQEAPGAFVAQMLVNEQLTHGWDLARATGQHTDVAPATAERALPAARASTATCRGPLLPNRSEQPVPADATAADRLVAYLGRDLG